MDDNRSTAFESSIKVRGVHLLPPVIGEKRRIELQRYKQQAVKLEKRLQNCKELKKNLEDLLKLQPLSARPQSAITFGDNSHIEALGINPREAHLVTKKNQSQQGHRGCDRI
ncbi:hypothetical protein JTB14_013547 [Gonioctena quinquepunctata]|nr:hypothetical protein JTB14_013547 [Gonioctena quinquepunctata]